MLDINITALIQVVNFFIAVIVLNCLLIRPVREILKARKAKMDYLLESAENFNKSAEQELSSYQTALQRARQEASLLRGAARTQALGEQQALVSEAGKRAQEQFLQAKQAILQEAQNARNALAKQVKPLAVRAVDRVLG